MVERVQIYKNHTRLLPAFHFFVLPVLLLNFLNDARHLWRWPSEGSAFATGQYEITFHVGDYFRRTNARLPDPLFLDVVPIRFGVSEDAHYRVPLLVSPFAYSTYRGS